MVPAYLEVDRIGAAVQSLREALGGIDGGVEIIVVDDGSTDGTAAAARAAGADVVLEHDRNRGKGAAVRTGVLAAKGDTIAFTDADLSYAPGQLKGLLEAVEGGADVVVGSRKHEDTRTLVKAGRLREVGGRVINQLTHAVLLGDYRDTQCGLKAFNADAARTIFGRSKVDRFAFDVEIFLIAETKGMQVEEVPVSIVNSSRSTVRIVRETARLMRDLFRIRRWSKKGLYR